jgi:hypothetical protein
MYPSTSVFNQYYFELLKKIRDKARRCKFESREARHILKGLKANYQSYDKTSDSHRTWFAEQVGQSDGITHLYIDVKLSDIASIFDKTVLAHFVEILKLFCSVTLSVEDVLNAVSALRNMNNKEAFEASIATIQTMTVAEHLRSIYEQHTNKNGEMDDALKRIEGTSLGKLAKEIMSEINMDEIQKSVEDGDILKSLSNPEGSLTKVLSTVSAKMISKMASGELKQESLLQDAMQLAADLGVGGGGAGGMGGMGDMAAMIQQLQKMGIGGIGGMGGRGGGGGKRPSARHVRRKTKQNKPKSGDQ